MPARMLSVPPLPYGIHTASVWTCRPLAHECMLQMLEDAIPPAGGGSP